MKVLGRSAPFALALLVHQVAGAAPAQVLYYEPLQQTRTGASAAQKSRTSFPYSFEAYGRRFDLELERNTSLALSKPSTDGAPMQLYRGSIDGVEGSWVRLGARGESLRGMMWDGTDLYVIETAAGVRDSLVPPLQAPALGNVIFKLADTRVTELASCGSERSMQPASGNGLVQYKAMLDELVVSEKDATRRIELSALGDAAYRRSYSTQRQAEDELLLRLNNVDGIYTAQLGIAVQVPMLSVAHPDSDDFTATTSPSALLTELGALRQRTPALNARGLTHLFTGRDLEGTTVGIAQRSDQNSMALCHPTRGVGLTQTANLTVWVQSLIAAHEIGHNFGAVHDDDSICGEAITGFIMAPQIHPDNRTFSQCSVRMMTSFSRSASCITPLSSADLALMSLADRTRAIVGRSFNWTVEMQNLGSATIEGAKVKVLLPPSIAIEEAWVVGGTCTYGGGVIDCVLGSVAGGVTRTLNTKLVSEQISSNSAHINLTASNDGIGSNNAAETLIDIEANADVSLALAAPASGTQSQALAGQYTLTNLSDESLAGSTLTFSLPTHVVLTQVTLGDVTCSLTGSVAQCPVALAPSNSLQGSFTVVPSASGAFTLGVTAATAGLDGDTANNSASVLVQIAPGTAPTSASEVGSQTRSGGRGGGGSMGWPLLLAAGVLLTAGRRRTQRTA